MLRERPTQVLRDAVSAGSRLCSIFKEPTVTPTAEQARATRPFRVQADSPAERARHPCVQKVKLGLKKTWGSPNGSNSQHRSVCLLQP